MDCPEWIRQMYMLAIAQRKRDQIDLDIAHHIRRRQQRRVGRGKRGRCAWTRGWVKRRREFGIYDQLMVELRREDPKLKKYRDVDVARTKSGMRVKRRARALSLYRAV